MIGINVFGYSEDKEFFQIPKQQNTHICVSKTLSSVAKKKTAPSPSQLRFKRARNARRMVAKLQTYEATDPSVAPKLQFWREALASAEYERANWQADQHAAVLAVGVGAEVVAAEVDIEVDEVVGGDVLVEEVVEVMEVHDEEAELARIEEELEKGPVFEGDEVVLIDDGVVGKEDGMEVVLMENEGKDSDGIEVVVIEDDVVEDKDDMEGVDVEATEEFWKMMNELPEEVVDTRYVKLVNKDSDDEVDIDVEVKRKDYEAIWRAKDDAARDKMGDEEWARKEDSMKRKYGSKNK